MHQRQTVQRLNVHARARHVGGGWGHNQRDAGISQFPPQLPHLVGGQVVAVRDRHHVNIVLLHRLHNLGGVGAVPQHRQVIASNNRALGKARQVERGGAQPGGDHAPQRLVQVTPGDDVGDNKDAGERAASFTPPH